ncbi:MAG: hypothetical protein LBI18_15975 [Planctomycetaceae bacterium]|jgi:hypothetical protein|nr:hypothetical protein [Planctomycetaceae bacterium]
MVKIRVIIVRVNHSEVGNVSTEYCPLFVSKTSPTEQGNILTCFNISLKYYFAFYFLLLENFGQFGILASVGNFGRIRWGL